MPSTEKTLDKIEKQLSKICEQQEAIVRRLDGLEGVRSGASADAISHDGLVAFLDQFRAGEALGEASLGAWIEVSELACVKGGLRTVQQREGMHARLLEARLKELGATPSFEIPEAVYEKAMQGAGDPDKKDAEKVADFVKQFPDPDAAIQPILDIANKLDHDQETQYLLRTIAQDERSTLVFLNETCQLLNG
jgi:hypothetical protein